LGYFREDYQWLAHAGEEEYLDVHNGRQCVTPEYPNGTYAYFCTVDENWNSAYPYAVGPTFYGTYANRIVNSITETTTPYVVSVGVGELNEDELTVNVFPNPTSELLAIQIGGLVKENLPITVFDMQGKLVAEGAISQGTTIWYLNTSTFYDGEYLIRIGTNGVTRRISIVR
jgi:hypothetical protein